MKSIPGFDPTAEGAISQFDPSFVDRTGEDTTYVKALSDLWTIALLKLWQAHDMAGSDARPVVYSPPGAVEVLRAVSEADAGLKEALFQEPFGFAEIGAIEENFDRVYGPGVYAQWRALIENARFGECLDLTRESGLE